MSLPRITTFRELDAFLLERSATFSADYLAEDHQTPEARQRALGKVAILSELRVCIARQVADELLATLVDGRPERADDALPDDHASWGAGGRAVAEQG